MKCRRPYSAAGSHRHPAPTGAPGRNRRAKSRSTAVAKGPAGVARRRAEPARERPCREAEPRCATNRPLPGSVRLPRAQSPSPTVLLRPRRACPAYGQMWCDAPRCHSRRGASCHNWDNPRERTRFSADAIAPSRNSGLASGPDQPKLDRHSLARQGREVQVQRPLLGCGIVYLAADFTVSAAGHGGERHSVALAGPDSTWVEGHFGRQFQRSLGR